MEQYIAGKVYEAVTFNRANKYVCPVVWTGETKLYDKFTLLKTKIISNYGDVYGGTRKEMLDGFKELRTMMVSKKTSRERCSQMGTSWLIDKTPVNKPEEHIFITTTYND
jgi:hypothetical protein